MWWLGAQYCLTREDSPTLAAACQWSSSEEAAAQPGYPGAAPLRFRTPAPRLPVRFCSPPAVRPTRLSNSFAVLADLNDEEAWPLPQRDSDRLGSVSSTRCKCHTLNHIGDLHNTPAAAESVKIEDDSLACVPSTTDTLDSHNSGPSTTDILDNGQCADCEVVGTWESRHGCSVFLSITLGSCPMPLLRQNLGDQHWMCIPTTIFEKSVVV